MKNLKRSMSGFMFMEVVIAVAILGIMSMAIFNLQSTILKQVWYESSAMERVLILRNYFFSTQGQSILQPKISGERQIVLKEIDQFSEVKFEVLPIAKNSNLYRKFPDLYLVQAIGTWSTPFRDQSETLVSLIHLVPQEDV